MTFHVQVNTYGDRSEDVFTGNARVYDTPEEATEAAKNLFMRWTAVRTWRVVGSTPLEGEGACADSECVPSGQCSTPGCKRTNVVAEGPK